MSVDYFYKGDYEDLIDWITDNYDPTDYKTFREWLHDVRLDFHTSNKHFSDDIAKEMKELWTDNFPSKPISERERLPETRKRNTVYNQVKEKELFTVKEVYDSNKNRPRASIRRELQELVRDNKIERVSKGVYRIK